MFKLCLFDLDETLIKTSDLEDIRLAGKNNSSPEYLKRLEPAIGNVTARLIYTEELLNKVRASSAGMKLGVFTRSPRSYATFLLGKAYPNIHWEAVVAYEDARPTKPSGRGVEVAMGHVGLTDPADVVLVGDNDVDVCAAYDAGCYVVVDRTSWSSMKSRDQWDAIGHVPDAFITAPKDLLEVLKAPVSFLPDLERRLAGGPDVSSPRFDEIGHFKPRELGGGNMPVRIAVCGRSFSNWPSVAARRASHQLSESIQANKNSEQFPVEWVESVMAFIRKRYGLMLRPRSVVVTVIPHKPGRDPRLENFLSQLGQAISQSRLYARSVVVEPELLRYGPGARSHHREHLNKIERFENVKDNLAVNRMDLVDARTKYLVIDDVTTTGASLFYAVEFLRDAGACDVTCLSIAKNVGDTGARRVAP